MNEQDLRDCFAMFALAGAMMANKSHSAQDIWEIADEMLEARNKKPESEEGIVKIKRARKS
jgi:hypothetical protein